MSNVIELPLLHVRHGIVGAQWIVEDEMEGSQDEIHAQTFIISAVVRDWVAACWLL